MNTTPHIGVSASVLKASRSLLESTQAKAKDWGGGIWRTTEDGSKIFISSGGEVRAGGPGGKVLAPAKNESKKQPEVKKPAKKDNQPTKGKWPKAIDFDNAPEASLNEKRLRFRIQGSDDPDAEIAQMIGQIKHAFGENWKSNISKLVGAPAGSSVTLDFFRGDDPGTVSLIDVDFTTGEDLGETTANRTIDLENMTITNESFEVDDSHRGSGVGTQIFHAQVQNAISLGLKSINTRAAKTDSANGYYTWARLGYDADLDDITDRFGETIPFFRDTLYDEFPEAERVSDLMKTAKGREWWKKNGVAFDGTFDLSYGSLSRKVLDAYVAAKKPSKPKQATKSLATNRAEIDKWDERLKALKERRGETIAAGLAVIAKDTGRILLLQRAIEETDPASGKFEFPGGHLEDGESPFDAAKREWEEETGLKLPKGKLAGAYKSGIYEAFFWLIDKESRLEINPAHSDREVSNPDDPKGKWRETAIWFDAESLMGARAVRQELLDAISLVRSEVRRIRKEHGIQQAKSIAKSCGANAKGGGGFQPGNTCGTSRATSQATATVEQWNKKHSELQAATGLSDDEIMDRLLAVDGGRDAEIQEMQRIADEFSRSSLGKKRSEIDKLKPITALDSADLPPYLKRDFTKNIKAAIENMPEKAVLRLNAIKQTSWSTNTAGIAKSLRDDGDDIPEGFTPGGAWDAEKGKLYLASDKSKSGKRGIYSHELAHVVDHNNGAAKFSDSSEWKEAWRAELQGGALTKYAATNQEEGFAEFARMAWLSTDSEHKASVRKMYPKASAVFEKAGLL